MIRKALLIFFIVDLWIFLYRYSLHFLNTHIHVLYSQHFIVKDVHPEPFEIPVYLFLTAFFVIIILLFNFFCSNSFKQKFNNIPYKYQLFLLFIAIAFFCLQLGEYPLSQSAENIKYVTPFMRIIATGVVLVWWIFIIVFLYIAHKYLKHKLSNKFFYLLTLILIGILLIEPGFPVSWFDYSYVFGPIYDIAHGSTIYTDISSLYGFLSVFLLSQLFRIHILSFNLIPFFIYILYIMEYFICFYLVYKFSKSILYSFIALFSIITINYFSMTLLPISVPQSGALRWVWLFVALYLLYKFKNITSQKFIFLLSISCFMQIDSGLYIFLSYCFTIFFVTIKKQITIIKGLKSISLFCISSVSVFFVIQIVSKLLGYSFIDISQMSLKLSQYYEGFSMIVMPLKSYFWFFILLYFSIVLFFIRLKKIRHEHVILLFSSHITFFSSLYFVGRSHPQNILFLSAQFLLTLFLFISLFYKKLNTNFLQGIALVILFFSFIVFPSWERKVSFSYIVYEKINRLGIKLFEDRLPKSLIYNFCKPQRLHLFDSEFDECLQTRYHKEAALIKNNIKNSEILIISPDDTYLLYLTNKKNMLRINPQSNINTSEELNFSLTKAIQVCPEKIVGDPRLFEKAEKNFSTLNFAYTIQPLLLQRLEHACKKKYQPFICTDLLCIANAI